MERLRQAPPSHSGELTPPFQMAPAIEVHAIPLLQRLQALREPGLTQQEVDAFMDGLSADPPQGESPRLRADLMLDILEDERLCELAASDGSRVGPIALEVLMELGFPYALEVTPAMLARARGPRPLHLPRAVKAGLGVAGINGLLYATQMVPEFVRYQQLSEYAVVGTDYLRMSRQFDDSVTCMPFFLVLLLGPAALSGLTLWLRLRAPWPVFNALQWLVGLWCVGLGLSEHLLGFHVQNNDWPVLLSGVLGLLSAWMLLPRREPGTEPTA